MDNQASLQALRKGYGRDASVNGLLCLFWSFVTRLGLEVVFEWVPSHLNISDPISRRDCQIAIDHTWEMIPPDLNHFWEVLHRCSYDLRYAAHQGAADCLSNPPACLTPDLVQDGIAGPEMVKTWPLGAVDLMAESHHTHLEGEKESALDLASVKLDGRSDMLC